MAAAAAREEEREVTVAVSSVARNTFFTPYRRDIERMCCTNAESGAQPGRMAGVCAAD